MLALQQSQLLAVDTALRQLTLGVTVGQAAVRRKAVLRLLRERERQGRGTLEVTAGMGLAALDQMIRIAGAGVVVLVLLDLQPVFQVQGTVALDKYLAFQALELSMLAAVAVGQMQQG